MATGFGMAKAGTATNSSPVMALEKSTWPEPNWLAVYPLSPFRTAVVRLALTGPKPISRKLSLLPYLCLYVPC